MKLNYLPYIPKLNEKARHNRNNPTKPESKIWNKILRESKTGYKFLRQKTIDNFILDFYCAALMLGIEIDGESHYDSQIAEKHDKKRTQIIEKLGIKLLRYRNSDVMNNIEGVYEDLMNEINKRKK